MQNHGESNSKEAGNLENNALLKNLQYGFYLKLSCTTNMIKFLQYTTVNIGKPINIIYDFSKVFDKVAYLFF